MKRKNKDIPFAERPIPPAAFKKAGTSPPFSLRSFTIVFISFFFLFAVLAFIWSRTDSNATIHTLTLAYVAFFLGTTFEFRRLCGNWKTVTLTMLGSFVLSFGNFLPYSGEVGYSLQNHLDGWPIVFSVVFMTAIVVFHSQKLTANLGEGITLLHSLTLLYFLTERFHSGVGSGWWVALCILPVCFSLIHALTHIEITESDRLLLSIWSSITMAVFAFVYASNVLQMDTVEQLFSDNRFWDGAYVFVEHFLLGASGAYIAQNVIMLFGYLPGRSRFFNAAYFSHVRELNESHVDRYSSDQADRREALSVLVVVGGILTGNFYLKVMAPSLAIWLCLIIAPLVVGLFGKLLAQVRGPI